MAIEIERKFLVVSDAWKVGVPTDFRQGYLNDKNQATVRVRIAGARAFLTVKGPTTGLSRKEFEYAIPVADAEDMLALCSGPLVEKKRWIVPMGDLKWEVDEFLGQNSGLVIAEIELPDEGHAFEKPDWVGEEVSYDKRYFNSNLSVFPFSQWPKSS